MSLYITGEHEWIGSALRTHCAKCGAEQGTALNGPCYQRVTEIVHMENIPERVETDTSELRLEAQKRMREIDGALLRNAADEIDALRTRAEKAEAELAELKTKHGAKYPREGYHP